jgi:hypothetical protein
MPKVAQTTIQCVNCRQPIRATVYALIEATETPQAKIALLSGGLNVFACPNCSTPNSVMTPLLYHDRDKELLISFVPMEMGLTKDAQEKAIGDLMRELTSNLPQGAFKAYMLQPRQALTMQGMVEQILQADGVTPEMMQAQRDRVRLVEQFIQAPPETLPSLVQQYDDQVDAQFMQTMTMIIQQVLAEGQQQLAEHIAVVQNLIVQHSTFGQRMVQDAQAQEAVIEEVAERVNQLGEGADRSDFMQLALEFADDDIRLQALVGLIRPVFDYTFFQDLTAYVSQLPAAERDRAQTAREKLLELTARVDQQAQAALQEAVVLLRHLLSAPDLEAALRENLPMIDSTFLQVLSANIQESQRRGDLQASARLKDLYNRILAFLQANMPPELRFINELLGAPSDDVAREMVTQRIAEFGPPLLGALDAVEQQLNGQGNPGLLERFAIVRQQVADLLR